MADKTYRGTINVDIRESKPDWGPFEPPKAKDGAPNVLYIVWDDTGIATWDCFGGLVETPNMTRIANLGLRYTQWHTTALCSPTRSCLLTGRNAHKNSMACITEGATGFPGSSGLIPPENGMLSEMLVEQGYNTYCVGKWHLTPENESNMASTRRTWPLGRGFERFYGFLGGETNQWHPDLVYDNHPVEPPASPEEGYHLSADLVDRALAFIRDGKQIAPGKPWLCYLSFGASHAPHHVPREWADKYKGRFDMGYEKYREVVLGRMKEMGTVPGDTELSPINPWPKGEVILEADHIPPWNTLSADQQRLFTRMAEIFAGFISYTDHQVGRLLDYLEQSGQLDNTVIVVVSDNGASGEGGPNGSVNENKFFNGWPDDLQENLKMIEELGGPDTYNHYPAGWAWAFNTPYKMFKRYTLEGGICDPMIIAWPSMMKDVAGSVRDQYHHAIDVVPTLLDCCGIEPPSTLKGYAQSEIQGVSMRYTFADPKAKSRRTTQYYAMLGTRAIYHDGWKAVARHGAISGVGNFMKDRWELYHIEQDRAEVNDLAAKHRDRLLSMVALWFAEAGRNDVLPLDDRSPREIIETERPQPAPPRSRYVYYPDTAPVPEAVAPNIRNKSFRVTAELTVDDPRRAHGVLLTAGSRFGGHVLFVEDGRLVYVYNFLGINEQRFVASEPLPAGKVTVAADFAKEAEDPPFVAHGKLTLTVNGRPVAEGRMRTQPGKFGLAGGVTVGRESVDPVCPEHRGRATFGGGTVHQVVIELRGERGEARDFEARRAMARD